MKSCLLTVLFLIALALNAYGISVRMPYDTDGALSEEQLSRYQQAIEEGVIGAEGDLPGTELITYLRYSEGVFQVRMRLGFTEIQREYPPRGIIRSLEAMGRSVVEEALETNAAYMRSHPGLMARRERLLKARQNVEANRRTLVLFSVISLGVGLAGVGTGITFAVLGSNSFDSYQSATGAADVDQYRSEAEQYDLISTAGFVTGTVGLLLSGALFLARPNADRLDLRLEALDRSIQEKGN